MNILNYKRDYKREPEYYNTLVNQFGDKIMIINYSYTVLILGGITHSESCERNAKVTVNKYRKVKSNWTKYTE